MQSSCTITYTTRVLTALFLVGVIRVAALKRNIFDDAEFSRVFSAGDVIRFLIKTIRFLLLCYYLTLFSF